MFRSFLPLLLWAFLTGTPFFLWGQQFSRIEADITIKERLPDSSYKLIMGKVYYNNNSNTLVYDIFFPKKQTWFFADTNYYVIENNKIINKKKYPQINRFTIFSLVLNGNLKSYGLQNGKGFEITNIEREEGSIYITWTPPKKYQDHIGNVILAQKKQQLTGVVFFNGAGEVIHKQFFENYTTIKGLSFPKKLVQINYIALSNDSTNTTTVKPQKKEHYKITKFENIDVDAKGHNKWYHYTLPVSH